MAYKNTKICSLRGIGSDEPIACDKETCQSYACNNHSILFMKIILIKQN